MRPQMSKFVATLFLAGLSIPLASNAVGVEFQANTYTPGDQQNPAAAIDAAGNFVVVWEDRSQQGIYGRQFYANGQPRGNEFRISGGKGIPSVAADAGGNFAVAWTGSDDSDEGIFARRYGASGNPVAPEFLVNTYTDARQLRPQMAMNKNGGFVVGWETLHNVVEGDFIHHSWYVAAKAYNAAGAPLSGELLVNQILHGQEPHVAIDDAGAFVVSYARDGDSDDLPLGHYRQMRRYNADGTPKGDAMQLSGNLQASVDPAIAMTGSGNAVIAWNHYPGNYLQDDIHVQRYDPAGNALGAEFIANTTTEGMQIAPSVTMNDSGQFLVAWSDSQLGDVFGQAYSAAGLPLGSEFRFNEFTDNDQRLVSVAMNDAGRYVATWTSQLQDGDGNGIFARIGIVPEATSLTLCVTGGLAFAALSLSRKRLARRKGTQQSRFCQEVTP
jgi:hypothetical protein